MKVLTMLAALGMCSFLMGCDRGTDTQSNTSPSPTSRDSDSSSRLYPGNTNAAPAVEPNNTGINKRDRSDATLTAGDQSNNKSDLETTQRIRQALTDNDQLSAEAKNIKIITVDGKVTLRGPVASEQEKTTIAEMVGKMGLSSVDNQLEVKSSNK